MLGALLEQVETIVNDMSDKDWSWWPFLWLRPAKDARLPNRRLVAIAVLHGLPMALLLAVAITLTRPAPEAWQASIVALVSVPLALLFHLTVVVAPMWNRRAARLARKQAAK